LIDDIESFYAVFGLEGVVEGEWEWKCEESWGCLDWGMLEWMCEESLLKIVSDVIVVRILQIILNSKVCEITILPLYIKKE